MLLLLLIPGYTSAKEPTIQQQIDMAKPGEIIKLNDGNYDESIIINKPIHLIGLENTTFIQQKADPVITVRSNNVVLENFNITYTKSNNTSPAILINGDNNSLRKINISTDSFGIQLDEANYNDLTKVVIIGNKDEEIKNRKHGIDLQNSHNNKIYDSQIKYVQDGIYVENSFENKISRNSISHSRYGTHLMFTKDTKLEDNRLYENISGMYIMGANGTIVKHNILKNNRKNIQSLGLLLFDTANAEITDNNIVNNRIGIFIESASNNKLAFNNIRENYIGVQFKRANNNNIANNSFIANVVQGQATESSDNDINNNYWGDHFGLDMTGSQTSDLLYKVDPFFLNITSEYPPFQLLFQSPGMVFLEQLISTPINEQLIDDSPLLESPIVLENHSTNQLPVILFCTLLLIISLLIIYLGVRKNEKV